MHDRYGPVEGLRLDDVPVPRPAPDEVLVRVAASSVHVDAWHTITGLPYALRLMGNGIRSPKDRVPGTDVAGTVEAVGSAVTRFRPGQRVWGGALGGYVVQLAVALDASRVTGVDAGDRLDLVRAAGADDVCDYTVEDVTRRPVRHDLVIDVASTRPFGDWRPVVEPDGSYVRVGHDHYGRGMNRVTGSIGPVLAMTAASPFVAQLPRPTRSTPRAQRLARLADLVAEGRLRPVVDRTFPLADVVPALQRLQNGEARGRLVLTVRPSG